MEARHLIFYDGNCGLCQWSVQWLLKHDSQQIFAFAPLQGSHAALLLKELLQQEPELDSMVLLEDFQSLTAMPGTALSKAPWLRSKAVFRCLWLLGGSWRLLGWKCFLPSWLMDWAYNLVARHRHRIFGRSEACLIPPQSQQHRFLD